MRRSRRSGIPDAAAETNLSTEQFSTGPSDARDRERGWQFWIDRGGTFTDIVAVTPGGRLKTAKLLSEAPEQYADAAVEGIDRLLAAHPDDGTHIDAVKIGTTVGTNALLERRGARTVLVTTRGLGDVLRIGTQQRPDLFALDVTLPDMLYESVIEADERIAADGTVLTAIDERALEDALVAARESGIQSVAIAFLHGYRFTDHEQRAAAVALRLGFDQVSVSAEISPRIRLVERGRTTVADASLSPVIKSYADDLRAQLTRRQHDVPLLFMQSHGGLAEADEFRGHNCILSGPAGGVVGMAQTAIQAGYANVIGFDMGGTSTDVSLFAGNYERADSTDVAGTTVAVPTMRINTVAAGGGSILDFRNGRLQVGPESAGAFPGPACYGHGGPLTLTDANVFLGRIQPDFFPRVFGRNGDAPIDAAQSTHRIDELVEKLDREHQRLDATAVAAGCLGIAVDHMAAAIEQISIQRGHDAREFSLSCFGGAGGQHACLVADALGISRVLIDPLAGVLSAYGIGIADLRRIITVPVEHVLDPEVAGLLTDRTRDTIELMRAGQAGGNPELESTIRFESRALLRSGGSDTVLKIDFESGMGFEALADRFEAAYSERFSFRPQSSTIAVEALEVESVTTLPRPDRPGLTESTAAPVPAAHRRAWISGEWSEVPIFRREELGAGSRIDGPAIIIEANATTIIEAGWSASVDPTGMLVLTRGGPAPGSLPGPHSAGDPECDPVLLEIFNNQFMHVAEQMGAVLEQTAESVNIRERLDYSCALFDASGSLIANAPHVPVHLGSMSDSVKAVVASCPQMNSGESFAINAPYSGGTHLPDITVVTPVFVEESKHPCYFVASRAHHADIGGLTPGSMPARSTHIDEEGVVIEPMRIVVKEELLEPEVRHVLGSGKYPARNVDRNVADLKAQLAANSKGVSELFRMLDRHGPAKVEAYTRFVQANAEECVREAIAALRDGRHSVVLDGGERIEVSVRIDRSRRSAVVDFSGTSPQSDTNYNAPASIAHAAVLYVFRTLVRDEIPLNAGCLIPLEIVLPAGSLVDPKKPAAVVAGNVETSQCIVDALLAALDAQAASQGTMNNFTFGNGTHQYYETICGGCGAGPGFDGATAVHSHMTNSRLTDPEVLELRYPVRLLRFEIREGSGGAGRFRGGDGVIREVGFLEPMHGSILANRRSVAPFGLAGGSDGAPGRNYLIRAGGEIVSYGAAAELSFGPGDRFVIETPGGGGYGPKADQ